MGKLFYDADWHKQFQTENGGIDGDTIDSASITGWSKQRVVDCAIVELQNLYKDKEKWNEWCAEEKATEINIAIHVYSVEPEDYPEMKLTLSNAWGMDPEWQDMLLVRINPKTGKAILTSYN